MNQTTSTVSVRLELDTATHAAIGAWADSEKRSTREQTAVLMRKLTKLRQEQPAELAKLGLLDRLLMDA